MNEQKRIHYFNVNKLELNARYIELWNDSSEWWMRKNNKSRAWKIGFWLFVMIIAFTKPPNGKLISSFWMHKVMASHTTAPNGTVFIVKRQLYHNGFCIHVSQIFWPWTNVKTCTISSRKWCADLIKFHVDKHKVVI